MSLITAARASDARSRGVDVDGAVTLVQRMFPEAEATFVGIRPVPWGVEVEVDAGGVHLLVPEYEIPHGDRVVLMVPCPHCGTQVSTGTGVSYLGNLAVAYDQHTGRRVRPLTRLYRLLVGCRH